MTADERAALARDAAPSIADEPWTEADLYCLDELVSMLDGAPVSYGHVVIDEAQDLSPMQARALGRRCPSGSMTILGDLAQARTTWAQDDWSQICRHLSDAKPTIETLSIGYRVPSSVLELAARQLPLIAPSLHAPQSVRTGRLLPQVLRSTGPLHREVVAAVEHARTLEMSIGIVTADATYDDLLHQLRTAGHEIGDGREGDFAHAATLVPASLVKGLEFDAGVVVEPADIIGSSDDGRRTLYSAMTRCTQALYVVHAQRLPEGLDHLDSTPSVEPTDTEQAATTTPSLADEVPATDGRQRLIGLLPHLTDDDVDVLLTLATRLSPETPRTTP